MPHRPRCWIVDLDGTLALIGDRSPYDWSRVGEDRPNVAVVQLIQALAAHPDVDAILVASGRDEACRAQTVAWLAFHDVPFDDLLMRPHHDRRADHIIKRELLNNRIRPAYDVVGVVDDRNSVVAMWRDEGLTCLQVAEGDF